MCDDVCFKGLCWLEIVVLCALISGLIRDDAEDVDGEADEYDCVEGDCEVVEVVEPEGVVSVDDPIEGEYVGELVGSPDVDDLSAGRNADGAEEVVDDLVD